ncbi:MAG TPA: HNH endonuclease [Ruminococcus flavefaciens]|nr:HNH endonuclease [Ruminococcus flavefaciens]
MNQLSTITPRQRLYAQILLNCIAHNQQTTTYGVLAEAASVSAQSVGKDIGELSKHCHEMKLPPISGMVINAETKIPDFMGFGGLCRELHIYDEYDNAHYSDLVQQCLKDIHECDRWHEFADYLGLKIEGINKIPDPIAKQEQSESIEGARIQITATIYERNSANREKCLQKWGTKCQICGFDAAAVYGIEFADLIHVHHINPLGMVGEAHSIDPEKDLIPVCPNCHMILHAKKDGVYMPDEVKSMLNKKEVAP